jgi:putative transposase
MGRMKRNDILYAGCYAHVVSRSIRRLKLFNDDEDFEIFKDLLIQAKTRAGFQIFHYCLMPTHFHLAVKMGDPKDFSFGIRDIKRGYAYKFHSKYKLSGPIWRERFKTLLIENEEYLYACGKYIEENPTKAKIVSQNTDWKHSSSRYYELNEDDLLINGYKNSDLKLNERLIINEEDFESGNVIGSDFFRFQFFDSRKRARPVTRE